MVEKAGILAVVAPHHFLPPRNGGHWGCLDFCEFSGRVVRLHCICVADNETPRGASFSVVNVLPLSWRRYIDPTAVLWLYKYFKAHDITSCVVIQPYQAPLTYLACRLARIRITVYAHNLEFARFRSIGKPWYRVIKLLEQVIYRLCDLVVFVSTKERDQAVKELKLRPSRCLYLPPVISECRAPVKKKKNDLFKIIFFADFSYSPNLNGLKNILENIIPLLDSIDQFQYDVEIFGKGLDDEFVKTLSREQRHLKYFGFVNNVEERISNADLLLNPVMEGGGVQIKILKALVLGTTVVSSRSGAIGIPEDISHKKLVRIEDRDWEGYVEAIRRIWKDGSAQEPTPQSFYDHFFWQNHIPAVVEKLMG